MLVAVDSLSTDDTANTDLAIDFLVRGGRVTPSVHLFCCM